MTTATISELEAAAHSLNKLIGTHSLDEIATVALAEITDDAAFDKIHAVIGDETASLGRMAQLPVRVDGVLNRLEVQIARLKKA